MDAAARHRARCCLLTGLVLASGCGQRREASRAAAVVPAPPAAAAADPRAAIDAVGAVDVFGQGIVALGSGGDRVLMHAAAPAYVMLVRLDSTGAIISGAASPRRYPPGSAWLEVPTAAGRRGRTAVATAPVVCEDLVYGTRRPCRAPASDLVVTSPALRTGEALLLFLTAEPFGLDGLDERLNAVGRRVPLTQLPGMVMDGRSGLWAAYLVRQR